MLYTFTRVFVIFTSFMSLFHNFKFHSFKSLHMIQDVILQILLIRSLKLGQPNNLHPLQFILLNNKFSQISSTKQALIQLNLIEINTKLK